MNLYAEINTLHPHKNASIHAYMHNHQNPIPFSSSSSTLNSKHYYNTRSCAWQKMDNPDQENVRVRFVLDDLRWSVGQILDMIYAIYKPIWIPPGGRYFRNLWGYFLSLTFKDCAFYMATIWVTSPIFTTIWENPMHYAVESRHGTIATRHRGTSSYSYRRATCCPCRGAITVGWPSLCVPCSRILRWRGWKTWGY